MLGSFRKFSKTIYAKFLLIIIVIPFIFWGMGSSFIGGNRNVVVVIDKEKYSINDFGNFIDRYTTQNKEVNVDQVEELLSAFIGEKLIEKEVEYFGVKLSDNSLSKLIRHQKDFKRDNKFSRIEYEKFLLERDITAVIFENILSKHEKKKQFLDLISGGVFPSKFLVNVTYNKINQKRNIDLINLNDVFKKKNNFTENQIKSYYENNIDKYKDLYKSVKILKLNPKQLIGTDEFSDLFFKKIDEIDELIIQGENLVYIVNQFNLDKPNLITLNKFGRDINAKKINNISENLIKNVFNIDDIESAVLIENKEEYYIFEIMENKTVQKKIEDPSVRKDILLKLEREIKGKLIFDLISKINKNNFNKIDFVNFSNNENVPIKKILISNLSDDKTLKKEIVSQIYKFPENKVIVVNDFDLVENYLIYIDKIHNVVINENSDDYEKYLNLTKIAITTSLYNTYDSYIKKKYEIDINYQALEQVKSNFN